MKHFLLEGLPEQTPEHVRGVLELFKDKTQKDIITPHCLYESRNIVNFMTHNIPNNNYKFSGQFSRGYLPIKNILGTLSFYSGKAIGFNFYGKNYQLSYSLDGKDFTVIHKSFNENTLIRTPVTSFKYSGQELILSINENDLLRLRVALGIIPEHFQFLTEETFKAEIKRFYASRT